MDRCPRGTGNPLCAEEGLILLRPDLSVGAGMHIEFANGRILWLGVEVVEIGAKELGCMGLGLGPQEVMTEGVVLVAGAPAISLWRRLKVGARRSVQTFAGDWCGLEVLGRAGTLVRVNLGTNRTLEHGVPSACGACGVSEACFWGPAQKSCLPADALNGTAADRMGGAHDARWSPAPSQG